jgi:Leucine-rich repeat (LRR) protein
VLQAGIFAPLTSLQQLLLLANRLTYIDRDAFGGISRLSFLCVMGSRA